MKLFNLLILGLLAYSIIGRVDAQDTSNSNYLTELDIKQVSSELERDLFRNKVNHYVDNFIPGTYTTLAGEVKQKIIDKETLAAAILRDNPDAELSYDNKGRLIFDPNKYGSYALIGHGFIQTATAEKVKNASTSYDSSSLNLADEHNILIRDLVILSNERVAEALKLSGSYNIVVDNVILSGGREDALDIVRGKNLYFRNVEFKSNHGGRGATIKSGADGVFIANSKFTGTPDIDCIPEIKHTLDLWLFKVTLKLFKKACHHVEVGNFGSYSVFDEVKVPVEDIEAAIEYKENQGPVPAKYKQNYLDFLYSYSKGKDHNNLFYPKRPKTKNIYIDATFEGARTSTHKGGHSYPVQFWQMLADKNTIYAFSDRVEDLSEIRARRILWHKEKIGDDIEKEWRKQTYDPQIADLKTSNISRIQGRPNLIFDIEKKRYDLEERKWNNHSFWGPLYYDGKGLSCSPYKKISWFQSEFPNYETFKQMMNVPLRSFDYELDLLVEKHDELARFQFHEKALNVIFNSIANVDIISELSTGSFLDFLNSGVLEPENDCPLVFSMEREIINQDFIKDLISSKLSELEALNLKRKLEEERRKAIEKRRAEQEKLRAEREEKRKEQLEKAAAGSDIHEYIEFEFIDGDDKVKIHVDGLVKVTSHFGFKQVRVLDNSSMSVTKDEVSHHVINLGRDFEVLVTEEDQIIVSDEQKSTLIRFNPKK
jgi:hypothetical protein